MAITILRLPTVKTRTVLSRSSIYLRMSENRFPKPISLGRGGRSVGWIESEIEAWLQQQIETSREESSSQQPVAIISPQG